MIEAPEFKRVKRAVNETTWLHQDGRVEQVVGLIIEAAGPQARVGEWCRIIVDDKIVDAEVVGFRSQKCLLMPLGELSGIRPGCPVRAMGRPFLVPAGEELLGRVIDGLGRELDGAGPIRVKKMVPTWAAPPGAMTRPPISRPLATGIRAIDGLLTVGEGQRVGIFAGSGVGKSTLMGMAARSCRADVNVICLVGERGRELREFIENDLGEEGLRRSVVVCSTSDQPALVRIKAAFTATAIAEHFRDQGQKVLLMMDSVTRFAMAQREVGLAAGEPPSSKGYTPSVFALLPKLMERAGAAAVGSITAFYTVLVDGDDHDEPIADAARSILDGHFVLSRALTSKGHYPPIDVLSSLSRTMSAVVDRDHAAAAMEARSELAALADVEDLVNIGAYKAGSNPAADTALAHKKKIMSFLQQRKDEPTGFEDTVTQLKEAVHEEIQL